MNLKYQISSLIYILLPCLSIFFMGSPSICVAQQRISGKVSGPNGDGVVAVRVRIAGASPGVSLTAADGSFTISCAVGDTLIFSHISYQLLKLPASLSMQVRLVPLEQQLDEVTVSTGYQRLTRERATGSFTLIAEKQLNTQVSTSVLSRLEAVTSGLVIDRTTNSQGNFTIRGLSSISGPRSPLIVLDNFPYEGDLNNINPNEVESITVLKDAAAASIWGTRAGNGVIVITTKKGKMNSPLSISLSAIATLVKQPDLYQLKVISTPDYINQEILQYSRGAYSSDISSPEHPALTPVVEILASNLSETEKNAQINALKGIDVRDEFSHYLYRRGINQQYALSLDGGSTKFSWRSSVSFDDNTGVLSEKFRRTALGFSARAILAKGVELSFGLRYTQSSTGSGTPGYGDILFRGNVLYPYARFKDDNGNDLPIIRDISSSYLSQLGGGRLLDWKYYPLQDYLQDTSTSLLQDILPNASLKVNLFKGLSAELRYQYERQSQTTNHLSAVESYAARSLINSFTQLPSSGAPVLKVPVGGILSRGSSELESTAARGQLDYQNSFGLFSLSAIAGAEIRTLRASALGSRVYGYDPSNLSSVAVDYTTFFPDLVTGFETRIPQGVSASEKINRYISGFTSAALTFKSRYTLSLSSRADGSNLFGAAVKDKWKPLASAGLAWTISSEPFYKGNLPGYLKLRVTYGKSGNADASQTAVTTIRYGSVSPYTGSAYAQPDRYYNPGLKWEKVSMLNIGLDFSALSSRLSGSIEYYRKDASDLFVPYPIDYTTGVSTTVVRNAGRMRGNGVDLVLHSANIKGTFNWESDLNLSYYSDRLKAYFLSPALIDISSARVSGVVGKPLYGIYGYSSAGLDPVNGDPLGILKGAPSKDYTAITQGLGEDGPKYFGPATPVFFGSLGNTFSYGNFALSVQLTFKLGYYYRSPSISYSSLNGYSPGHSDFALRWQKPGDELNTNVPSEIYPSNTARDAFYLGSEVLVKRGDHIRLNFINLDYSLPLRLAKKVGLARASLFANASNLGLIWKAGDEDPEYLGNSLLSYNRNFSIGFRAGF